MGFMWADRQVRRDLTEAQRGDVSVRSWLTRKRLAALGTMQSSPHYRGLFDMPGAALAGARQPSAVIHGIVKLFGCSAALTARNECLARLPTFTCTSVINLNIGPAPPVFIAEIARSAARCAACASRAVDRQTR